MKKKVCRIIASSEESSDDGEGSDSNAEKCQKKI